MKKDLCVCVCVLKGSSRFGVNKHSLFVRVVFFILSPGPNRNVFISQLFKVKALQKVSSSTRADKKSIPSISLHLCKNNRTYCTQTWQAATKIDLSVQFMLNEAILRKAQHKKNPSIWILITLKTQLSSFLFRLDLWPVGSHLHLSLSLLPPPPPHPLSPYPQLEVKLQSVLVCSNHTISHLNFSLRESKRKQRMLHFIAHIPVFLKTAFAQFYSKISGFLISHLEKQQMFVSMRLPGTLRKLYW